MYCKICKRPTIDGYVVAYKRGPDPVTGIDFRAKARISFCCSRKCAEEWSQYLHDNGVTTARIMTNINEKV